MYCFKKNRFDDIVQLDEAKRLLCEAVQLPLQYPSIFTGLLRYLPVI